MRKINLSVFVCNSVDAVLSFYFLGIQERSFCLIKQVITHNSLVESAFVCFKWGLIITSVTELKHFFAKSPYSSFTKSPYMTMELFSRVQ